MGVALVLLAAAVAMAVRQTDLQVLWQAPIWVWLMFGVLIAGNLLLASLMFWVVTLSFDASPRVGLGRMTMLVTASALLNFLPFRPGLIGRAAILRTHHNLPLKQSMWILLVVLATGGLVSLCLGLAALFITNLWVLGVTLACLTAALTLSTGPLACALLRRTVVMAWLWVPIRVADALLASLRIWLAFWVMGHPLDARQALIAGSAGLIIAMVGLTPNGLGLKEWAIALISQSLAATTVQLGLAASLVDRSMEAITLIVLGLIALWMMRSWLTSSPSEPSDTPTDKPTGLNSITSDVTDATIS